MGDGTGGTAWSRCDWRALPLSERLTHVFSDLNNLQFHPLDTLTASHYLKSGMITMQTEGRSHDADSSGVRFPSLQEAGLCVVGLGALPAVVYVL